MDVESIYKNLTGVDIKDQEDIWDERGKGYFGEFLLFRELFVNAPGNGKFLMNLEIPGLYTNDTEIDLLFLHETGIYVFEVKHYKGIIYGKVEDDHWTQFFKTTKNNVFYNPVKQNEGHIKALKALIKKEVPIHSFIVFTNTDVDLRITGSESGVSICYLNQVSNAFNALIAGNKAIYDAKQLDDQYSFLLPYSKVVNAKVPVDSDTMKLPEFLSFLAEEREKYKDDYELKKKAYLKRFLVASLAIIVIAAGTAFGAITAAKSAANRDVQEYKAAAEKSEIARLAAEAETDEMRKNFMHVVPVTEGGIIPTDDAVYASDVMMSNSQSVNNAIELSFTINIHTNNAYGLKFGDAQIIVQANNGKVYEYSLSDSTSDGVRGSNSAFYQTVKSKKLILNNIQTQDIDYIKLKKVYIVNYPYGNTIRDDFEIELYKR